MDKISMLDEDGGVYFRFCTVCGHMSTRPGERCPCEKAAAARAARPPRDRGEEAMAVSDHCPNCGGPLGTDGRCPCHDELPGLDSTCTFKTNFMSADERIASALERIANCLEKQQK